MLRWFVFIWISMATPPIIWPQTIEERRLQLDEKRLAFEGQEYAQDHDEEIRKDTLTALSIGVPILLAALAYIGQVWTKRKDEKLAFQLKAAEHIMASRDTNQAKGKAQLLATIFKERLNEVASAVEGHSALPYFGRTNETREFLLELLAKYPDSRADIIKGWGILFPWDADSTWNAKSNEDKKNYKWFHELNQDKSLNSNRPTPTGIVGTTH